MGQNSSKSNINNLSDDDIKENLRRFFIDNKDNQSNETTDSEMTLGTIDNITSEQEGGRRRYLQYENELQNILKGGSKELDSEMLSELSQFSEYERLQKALNQNAGMIDNTSDNNDEEVMEMNNYIDEPTSDEDINYMDEVNNYEEYGVETSPVPSDINLNTTEGDDDKDSDDEDNEDNDDNKEKEDELSESSDNSSDSSIENDNIDDSTDSSESKDNDSEDISLDGSNENITESSIRTSPIVNLLPFYSPETSSTDNFSFQHPYAKNRF